VGRVERWAARRRLGGLRGRCLRADRAGAAARDPQGPTRRGTRGERVGDPAAAPLRGTDLGPGERGAGGAGGRALGDGALTCAHHSGATDRRWRALRRERSTGRRDPRHCHNARRARPGVLARTTPCGVEPRSHHRWGVRAVSEPPVRWFDWGWARGGGTCRRARGALGLPAQSWSASTMALKDPTRPVEERPLHPRAPRPKQRTVRSYRVPPREKRHGLVVVHTGDGKGKTTAALGILLRATGRGMKVAMLQFIKTAEEQGEHMAARRLGVEIVPL